MSEILCCGIFHHPSSGHLLSLRSSFNWNCSAHIVWPYVLTADGCSAEEKTALISKLSLLKATAMSAPFLAAFAEQSKLQGSYKDAAGAQQMDLQPNEAKGDLKIVKYREEEAIYIQASHDRVTVIFSTVFKEETDRIYGKVFLQVRVCNARWTVAADTWRTSRNSWMRGNCRGCRALRR